MAYDTSSKELDDYIGPLEPTPRIQDKSPQVRRTFDQNEELSPGKITFSDGFSQVNEKELGGTLHIKD